MAAAETRNVLGTEIAVVDYASTLERIDEMVRVRRRGYVCCVSVHGLVEARRDADLATAFAGAELCVADGMPVVWALRKLGAMIGDRVYGPALMDRCCARGAERGYRMWLYGGRNEEAQAQLRAELEGRHPGVAIVGGWAPPFRPLEGAEEDAVAERINADRPDIVWCGTGTPGQERWMATMRPRLEAPVLAGVGAAFDLIPGRVRSAPQWMQRRGLEWAYRMAREPRRLAPRYLRSNPRFVAAFARQYVSEGRAARRAGR